MSERLFDSSNYKLRGKGVDSKGNKKRDKLLFNWKWDSSPGSGMPEDAPPCKQVSQAKFGDFVLEAIYFHTEYEGGVNYFGGYRSQGGFKTRISAQLGAEKMLENLLLKHSRLYKKIKILKIK